MTQLLADVLSDPSFSAGLRPGVVALGVSMLIALIWRAAGDGLPPVAGLLLGTAVIFGLAGTGRLPDGLVLGLAALGIGGLVAEALGTKPLVLAGLAAPGAYVIVTQAELVDVVWVQVLLGSAIVLGSVLLTDFDTRWAEEGAGPVLVAISAAAIWATVPDTEQALVLLGAAIPLGLLGWPRAIAALGPSGSCVVVGLLAWTGAAGGADRLSSIIGATASLGLLLVEPLSLWFAKVRGGPFVRVAGRWWAVFPLAATHVMLVLVAGRYAGVQRTVTVAAWIAATTLGVALIVAVLAGRRLDREFEPFGRRKRSAFLKRSRRWA